MFICSYKLGLHQKTFHCLLLLFINKAHSNDLCKAYEFYLTAAALTDSCVVTWQPRGESGIRFSKSNFSLKGQGKGVGCASWHGVTATIKNEGWENFH